MWVSTNTAEAKGQVDLLPKESTTEEKLSGDQKKLTRLEHDVLWRLSNGEMKPHIAKELSLSVRTIDLLVDSAVKRLNAASPIHAVSLLLRNGDLDRIND